MPSLEEQVKQLLIKSLQLEDMTTDDIETEMPLFGDVGLGLDSIDALELGMAIHKEFGVKLSAESAENKEHFKSVQTIANLIKSQQKKD